MYINFSDGAKFAIIAKNIVEGNGFGNSFSFWAVNIFQSINDKIFSSFSTPPVMPYSIAAFFKIFGINDFAVIATSFFYFLLTLVFVYFLGKKIFNSLPAQAGKLVGFLSTLIIGFNYDLIHYATNGSSESPFIFEIVAASYFASIKKMWANIVTILFLVLMYFTRPQAFIYIAGIILYWLLTNLKPKKALLIFVGLLIVGILIDYFVLVPVSGTSFLYSIVGRVFYSSFSQTSIASNALRGAGVPVSGILQILKNVFYNIYNFYKLLPEIMSPYLVGLFMLSLFIKTKSEIIKNFKMASVFMIMVTFFITAASIPFYRYLHPIIPLVYIIAVGTFVQIMAEMTKFQSPSSKQITINKLQIPKRISLVLGSCLLVLFFGVGQTLGVLLLDSRFEKNTHNVGKPPVYVELSKVLKENTNSDDVVVTNLDTWGSWYGERKTVWFPLTPKQLIDPNTGDIPFDAIYLTSYKIDDANYYMGKDWRMIFENPENPNKWTCEGCPEVAKVFKLKRLDIISSVNNYEKHDGAAVLLVKK